MIIIKRYIVRLTQDYNEEIKNELQDEGIRIIFSEGVLPNLIGIETELALLELRQKQLFKSVEYEPIGRLLDI